MRSTRRPASPWRLLPPLFLFLLTTHATAQGAQQHPARALLEPALPHLKPVLASSIHVPTPTPASPFLPSALCASPPPPAGSPAELTRDCVCAPQHPRKPGCGTLLLQIGDYGALPATPPVHPPVWVSSRLSMAGYAALHGYAYLFVDTGDANGAFRRSAAWLKLPCIAALLPFFDAVTLSDVDIYPSNLLVRLEVVSAPVYRPGGPTLLAVAAEKKGACTGFMSFRGVVSQGGGGLAAPPTACPPTDGVGLLRDWWRVVWLEPELERFSRDHSWEQKVFYRRQSTWYRYYRPQFVLLRADSVGTPKASKFNHAWGDVRDRKYVLAKGLRHTVRALPKACVKRYGPSSAAPNPEGVAACKRWGMSALKGEPLAHPTITWADVKRALEPTLFTNRVDAYECAAKKRM